ncbi:hypothetical protein J7E91_25900 [Streptomyces sp. ISL-99]|uniref:hypothetical protein n=1 Tax=Streptomyces sp. ISL-99 TaxID=2819193 RepID=UPI001BEA0420|nr:hypothetical protein [Streptomyces sp. ISL-99]MBT2528747.1 hypothetical protein [Streptomyces sp. ISL-99]
MNPKQLSRLAMTSLAVLLPFTMLTGCSSDKKSDVPSAGGKTSADSKTEKPGAGDPDADVLKFVRCLRENDIEVDDPETNGNVSIQVTDTQDQAKISKAQNACKQYMDEGASGGGGAAGGGKETEEQKVWRLKVERCLRDKGFKMGNVAESERAAHEKASKECYKEAGPVPGAGQ